MVQRRSPAGLLKVPAEGLLGSVVPAAERAEVAFANMYVELGEQFSGLMRGDAEPMQKLLDTLGVRVFRHYCRR